MSGLGLVMEFMLEVLGLPFFPFFLLFWCVSTLPLQLSVLMETCRVIINVSVAFLDLAAIDPWYSYG